MTKNNAEKKLAAVSGFGLARGPFVSILLDEETILQMTPEEARHHAMCVLQCAEAAETDGFLVEHFKANMPRLTSDQQMRYSAELLRDFRSFRDKLRRRNTV